MSKLSFRARALDASKAMPIYLSEELPDLPEYLSINRAVPQMPSGMEKEEESERHLQEAISAGKVIPTPEVFGLEQLGEEDRLDLLYPHNNKVPKQYIHYQSYAVDNDVAEYDMDSEDEKWINSQVMKMEVPLTYDQFEDMMDRLEKGSGQQVITLKEAKLLLKEDDELIVAVYDYWLNKRLRLQYPLIPTVKTEKAAGVGHTNNPYIAFRRRIEKMQTRKNRKNDETSYEKMLKLRRGLSRAVTILEMIKRREKIKKEQLHLTVEIFEKRYSIGDYSGQVLTDVSSRRVAVGSPTTTSGASAPPPPQPPPAVTSRPAYNSPVYLNQHQWATKDDLPQKEKRSYKKRKHSRLHTMPAARPSTSGFLQGSDVVIDTVTSDEDEQAPPPPPSATTALSEDEPDPEPDGEFTFRRKRHCSYLAPLLTERLESGEMEQEPATVRCSRCRQHHRYSLGSLRQPRRSCLGLVRRRVGRGGRLHFCSVERPSPHSSPELVVENYLRSLPPGYHIEGTAAEDAASPCERSLTVHLVPSSGVRLIATPEAAASPPRTSPEHTLSAFSVTPSDTFSELVTNLISPYLVDGDGVLLTSAECTAELDGDSDGSWEATELLPDSTATVRPADYSSQERCDRTGSCASPMPVTSAPSCLVTFLGGCSGGVTTATTGHHVLLADTPPTLELITSKADTSQFAGSVVQSMHGRPSPLTSHPVKKLMRKSSGAMEVK